MTFINKIKKLLNRNKKISNQVIYKNSTSKYSLTAECTMELSSHTKEKKIEIETHLKQLITKYIESPEKLINYIKLSGCEVYRLSKAAKILSFLGLEEGFIVPLGKLQEKILTILIAVLTKTEIKKLDLTNGFFIFDIKDTEIYTIARALYKYYGHKNNLPGYDNKSQSVYRRIFKKEQRKTSDSSLNNLKIKDVLACKEALKRDLESIDFVLQLSLEHERSKKVLKKIIEEKSTNI